MKPIKGYALKYPLMTCEMTYRRFLPKVIKRIPVIDNTKMEIKE